MKKSAKQKAGDEESTTRYVPIVDGGWGWVVVVGSFFIHVFADGIVYSFGVLLEIIMKVSTFICPANANTTTHLTIVNSL